MFLVEVRGRTIPAFLAGTDYITNLLHIKLSSVLWKLYIWDNQFITILFIPELSILVHLYGAYKSIQCCWLSPHTPRYCLILQLLQNLGFTDQAGFFHCLSPGRATPFMNRTPVRKTSSKSFYECSL